MNRRDYFAMLADPLWKGELWHKDMVAFGRQVLSDLEAAEAKLAEANMALQRIRIRLDQTDPCNAEASALGISDADGIASVALRDKL